MMDIQTDKIIQKIRRVACPLKTTWWKWTTHEGLLTFFGRDNNVELRPGGPYEIYFLMDNPPGKRGGEGNVVLSYLPEKMLSFSWNAPPEYPEIRNHAHKTWVVVHFTSVDEDTTEVVIDHLGWPAGEKWEEVYTYFDRAWTIVLDWLEDSCRKV